MPTPPYYLVHAGTSLYRVGVDGSIFALTLPAGVTVTASRPARFAILQREILVTNAVSRNIVVDPYDLSTRLLSIAGPGAVPTLAVGASGVLDGEYRYLVTFRIVDDDDRTLTESPYSAIAGPITVTNQQVDLSAIPISLTAGVNQRVLYRTANGGSEFFELHVIDDNTTTVYSDNTSDYDLALLPNGVTLGNPPGVDGSDRLRLVASWKDRIWGSPANDPDKVYYTDNRVIYAWGAAAFIVIQPEGADEIGVTAFLVRRDDLVVGKKRAVWIVRGIPPSTIQTIQVFEGPGPLSQDASLVVHDVCYYLGEDGFYEVKGTGVARISDERVRPWFITDDYFNRAAFPKAFAVWNPRNNTIELSLASAGSTVVDSWVSFDITRRVWLGPHVSGAFTRTMAGLMDDQHAVQVPVVGSSAGKLYTGNSGVYSDDGTAIDFDAYTKRHAMNSPDIDKYFGELAIESRIEAAGTLTITPAVGGFNAAPGAAIAHNLTTGRQRLRRIGTGRTVQYRLRNAENNQGALVYGLEQPFHELGRR